MLNRAISLFTRAANRLDGKPYWVALAVGIALLTFIHAFAAPLRFAGDEPRYLWMAVSLYERQDLRLPFSEWEQYAQRHDIPAYSPEVFPLIHSPLISVVLAPFVGTLGPDAGRWVTFLIGLIGFVWTAAIARREAGAYAGLLAAMLAFVTLPILPYMGLFYTEIWLLTFFAIAWYLLNLPAATPYQRAAFLLTALILPYIHLRMSLVSVTLISLHLWDVWRGYGDHRQRDSAYLATVIVAAAVAGAGFLAFQHGMTGSLRGTATAPFAPSLGGYFERLAVQMFTLRHGLFVFNPLLLLGAAALVAAAMQGHRLARQALLLIFVYSVTFVWGAASESPPARFWVAVMPAFVVGLALWLNAMRSVLAVIVTVPFAAVALVNAALYVVLPDAFLENYEVAVSYDLLFQQFPAFYVAAHLPWDKYFSLSSGWGPHYELSVSRLVDVVAVAGGVLTLSAVGYGARRYLWIQRAAFLGVIGIGLAVLMRLRTCEVPAEYVEVEELVSEGAGGLLAIRFGDPAAPSVLRFEDSWNYWPESQYPDEFEVRVRNITDGAFSSIGVVPAGRIVSLPPMDATREVRLRAVGGVADAAPWHYAGRVTVLAPECGGLQHVLRSVPLGEMLQFGPGGNGGPYLIRGWSRPEAWGGAWSVGKRAELVIVVSNDTGQPLQLDVEAVGLLPRGSGRQTAQVKINGLDAGSLHFDGVQNRGWRRFVVPSEALAVAGPVTLYVAFEIDEPTRPIDLGMNQDRRRLGIGLLKAVIHEAKDAD